MPNITHIVSEPCQKYSDPSFSWFIEMSFAHLKGDPSYMGTFVHACSVIYEQLSSCKVLWERDRFLLNSQCCWLGYEIGSSNETFTGQKLRDFITLRARTAPAECFMTFLKYYCHFYPAGAKPYCAKLVKLVMDQNLEPLIVFSFSKVDCEFYATQMNKMDFNTGEWASALSIKEFFWWVRYRQSCVPPT